MMQREVGSNKDGEVRQDGANPDNVPVPSVPQIHPLPVTVGPTRLFAVTRLLSPDVNFLI